CCRFSLLYVVSSAGNFLLDTTDPVSLMLKAFLSKLAEREMLPSDSVGLALLRAIIESESRTYVRNLRPELFVQEEKAAYEFFVSCYRQHGRAPTLQIMQE